MTNNDYFINARPGDTVYCLLHGNGTITNIDLNEKYCITVLFNSEKVKTYDINGYRPLSKVTQLLYWRQPKIIDYGRGCQALRPNTLIMVSNNKEKWYPRYFKCWTEHCKPIVYMGGKDSETTERAIVWEYWRMPRDGDPVEIYDL